MRVLTIVSKKHARRAVTTLSVWGLAPFPIHKSLFAAGFSSSVSFDLKNPMLLDQSALSSTNDMTRQTFAVLDPSSVDSGDYESQNDGVIANVYTTSLEGVKKSIEMSNAALPSWRDETTGLKRSEILYKWDQLVKDNADDLAKIATMESGKPLAESYGEVAYGASFLQFYAGEAIRPTSAGGGFLTPTPFADTMGKPRGQMMAIQEAVGVTAMITPWNFPIAMLTRKVAPALAAGCTVLVKPSELTPLCAIALHNLAIQAGVPPQVFQLLIADTESTPRIGNELCSNEIVRKISFTGSTKVGKLLMKLSSYTVKRLSLELGGNAAFIVFEDANIDQAVSAAIVSKFRNSGQTCVCADRFIIHSSVEQEFISKLVDRVKKIQVGPGIDPFTTMGPLISSSAALNVRDKVDTAIKDGAECVIGGNLLPQLGPNFYEPTILRNVRKTSSLWTEETFGPVVAIRTFDTEEVALELANDTKSGLASYFCTENMKRVFRVSKKLQCGLLGINEGIISTATAPFGGVKESGLGREGSSAGVAEYLETKYIFLND